MFVSCRELEILASKVEEYEKLLRRLSLTAAKHDQTLIQRVLDTVHLCWLSAADIADRR